MNPKQKLYQQNLTKYLIQHGIKPSEAKHAASLAVKTLKSQGAGFQPGHAKKMGEWMLKQKDKLEDGTLEQKDDGSVYDSTTGILYEKA